MKKIIRIIGALFLLLILLFIGFLIDTHRYMRNYYSVIDLPNRRSYSFVTDVYGEPQNIIYEEDSYYFIAQYDGIEFVFHSGYFSAVRIYSPEFRFGRKKIGVGSTREEIKEAYKWFKNNSNRNRQIFDHPDGGLRVIDGLTWIDFYFDENERVNKMVIYNNGP